MVSRDGETAWLDTENVLIPHPVRHVTGSGDTLARLAKEYYDWRIGPTGYFSRRDLIADATGILLATGLILF